MSAALKLSVFSGLLLLAFVASVAAGRSIDPERPAAPEKAAHSEEDGRAMSMPPASHGAAGVHALRGLAVEAEGVRLIVDTPEFRRGKTQRLSFRIVDADGATVREFKPTHTKRMHLILVRRDLTGFQHLHPKMSPDGSWNVGAKLDRAGSYRVFADFLHDDEPVTLASDLRVDGVADLKPLPAPTSSAVTDDGYRVHFRNTAAVPGKPTELRFAVTLNGRPVEVEQYLGAAGHLVALRDGDLAFLHVHPEEHSDAPREVTFEATFPTTGYYRLFLQFQRNGRVQTVALTQEVK